MNSYINIDDLWIDTLIKLKDSPIITSRVGNCKETLAFQVKLTNIDQTFLLNKRRKLSPYYACAEMLWYMQPTKSIEMIKAYAPQYIKFAENNEAHGAYGYRIFKYHDVNQLVSLIRMLRAKCDTRQAIIAIWDANDINCSDNVKDMPCTLSLQFLIRNEKLHLIVTMRSNDVWLGLPYDIFAFTCIQRLVAHAVGIKPGWYVHQAGSEHLYEKHWQAAEKAINSYKPVSDYTRYTHDWDESPWEGDAWQYYISQALKTENDLRNTPGVYYTSLPLKSFLLDLVLCCGYKWQRAVNHNIHSPILQEAIKHVNS